jgi:glutamate 5-kinase
MSPQQPIHGVVALDESLFVDGMRVVDRNAVVDVAQESKRHLGDTNRGIVLVLDRCATVGRIRQGELRSAGREQRPHIYQSIGVVPVLQFLLQEFENVGLRCGLVNVSRESFADRRQYFGIRDVVRGLLRNAAVPVIVDLGGTGGGLDTPHADYLQIAAMLAGMLGAGSLDMQVDDGRSVRFSGPDGPLGNVMTDDFDALWRAGTIETSTEGRRLIEPLLAAARLLSHSGATITVSAGAVFGAQQETLLKLSSHPRARAMTGVQRWLVAGAVPEGTVVASEYAATMLTQADRGSLLAAGVVRCEGAFEKDSVVSVLDEDGRLLGYGISRYGTVDLERVRGTPDVVVVHADHFFGLGLGALATVPTAAAK